MRIISLAFSAPAWDTNSTSLPTEYYIGDALLRSVTVGWSSISAK
jgi:hypothetical protein